MDFEPLTQLNMIIMGVNKNTENFMRDTFSKINAIYNLDDNSYELLKTEKEFNSKREYKKYISKYSNNMCKLYKSDYIEEEQKLGTLLLDFLKYDFTNFDSFCEFVYKYGLPAISFNLTINKLDNAFKNCSKLNIVNDKDNVFYTESDFYKTCKENFKQRSEILIAYQNRFDAIIRFINNLFNLDYLNDLSIGERFYIYQMCDSTYYLANSTILLSAATVSYDISPMKDLGFPKNSKAEDFENFEEKVISLANHMKSHPQEYNKKTSIYIKFNCYTIETACLISILNLVQNNIPIAICKNCGNYFIPSSKKNTLYCDNIFENGKTCQEIGAMITYNEKLKKDEITSLYRKTLSAKKMLANRNPDIPMYLEKYEQWKKEANEFRQKIKKGKKTEEEFKQWIEETRKK